MRDFAIVFVHAIVTLARLARPGGVRSMVAESVFGPASTAHPHSRAQACAQPACHRSHHRRPMYPFHAHGTCPSFRHRSETFTLLLSTAIARTRPASSTRQQSAQNRVRVLTDVWRKTEPT